LMGCTVAVVVQMGIFCTGEQLSRSDDSQERCFGRYQERMSHVSHELPVSGYALS
jgi:hypothetical protein